VADGLQVISARLLVTDMGVQTRVSCSTSQILTVSEGDVLSVAALVAFGETEVDDVNSVLRLVVAADEEVVGLDVSVDNSLFVDHLDALDQLHRDVQHRLEIELAPALLEEVLQTLAEHVHNHDMEHLSVLGLLITHKVEIRHRSLPSELVDELGLPEKHDVLLVFDSLLNLSGEEVSCLLLLHLVDFSKRSATQSLNDLISLVKDLLAFFHRKF